ncbi:MAG TPA: CopD family protein, partial [Candidatus Thermoplasmatota archaeon]|nr:CopD family protein [Candidatus Thermoplasmatota archaeon]
THVPVAPALLRLEFTENLEREVTGARVLHLNGTRMDAGQAIARGEPNVLLVTLRPLPDGVYTVDWVTLSVDTHTASGSYLFAVGNATLEGVTQVVRPHDHPGGAVQSFEAASHVLLLAGSVLAAGLAFFALAVARTPDLRLLRVAGLAALAGAAGSLLSLLVVGWRTGLPLATLALGTETGRWMAARTLLLAAAAFAVVRRPRAGLPLAAAALVATSLSSHAAATADGRALALAADALHQAAACVWAGGVVGLLLVLPGAGIERAALLVRRFSPWAAGSVLLLAATGTYAGALHVGSWQGLVATAYGRAVLAKVALLVALLGLGALNRLALGPRLAAGADRRAALRRTVQAETLLMAVVLGVTGVLTTLPLPGAEAAGPDPPPAAFSQVLRSGHLTVHVSPQPVTVGIQTFTVELHPLSGPVPEGTQVYLKFQAPGRSEPEEAVPAEPMAPGTWTARGGFLTTRGDWTVHVLVQNLVEYATPTFQVQVS